MAIFQKKHLTGVPVAPAPHQVSLHLTIDELRAPTPIVPIIHPAAIRPARKIMPHGPGTELIGVHFRASDLIGLLLIRDQDLVVIHPRFLSEINHIAQSLQIFLFPIKKK